MELYTSRDLKPALVILNQDLGNRKMQLVLDIFVVASVLVGVVLGLFVAQVWK